MRAARPHVKFNSMSVIMNAGNAEPEDVAVCGCDGIPLGSQLIPPLTTVILDYSRLGQLAVEHLLADNRQLFTDSHIKLQPRLEARQSA